MNRIAVTARVGNLRGTGTQTLVLGIDPVRGETDYWFSSVRRANGRATELPHRLHLGQRDQDRLRHHHAVAVAKN